MNLMEDLARLQGLHQELLGLAKGGLKTLREGRLKDLDDAWAKRGRVFERIEALSRRLAPAFADWPSTIAGLTPRQKQKVDRIIESVRSSGTQVLQIDAEASVLINEAKDSVGTEIKRIDDGKRLINAYSTNAPKGPIRFSRLG